MRIEGARTRPLPGGNHCLLELTTDEGITGQAPCFADAATLAIEWSEEWLEGRDPRAVSTLWDVLDGAVRNGGAAGSAQARAALDIACWDIKARCRDEPLWKALGGGLPDAVAYASWPAPDRREDPATRRLEDLASAGGFHRGLMHLGDEPGEDAERLGQIRDALSGHGRPVELMADMGQAWPDDARRRIAALESDYDLAWVKGIAHAGDYLGVKRVADAVAAAVCAGGDLCLESDFLPLLHTHAVNVVELDPLRLGITGTLRVGEAAFGYEIPVVLSATPGNLAVHLAGVLPNFMGMEVTDVDGSIGGLASVASFTGGRATTGARQGLGLEAGGSQ